VYSAVKQWLKCNPGKAFNCLNEILLTVILSIKKRVFLVEYVFGEGNRYTDLVQETMLKNSQKHLYLIAAKSADYLDRPHTLNELKNAITVYIRNISQADLQKMFGNKIKLVQACMDDARGHNFQHQL
jgi:hypothetical protein